MGDQKKPPEAHDLLTMAAEAIGSTLGKLAVKTGIAKPPASAPKRRRPAAKKAAPVKKAAARTRRSKAASKTKPPQRTARGKKGK
jgi:hypothetical protein